MTSNKLGRVPGIMRMTDNPIISECWSTCPQISKSAFLKGVLKQTFYVFIAGLNSISVKTGRRLFLLIMLSHISVPAFPLDGLWRHTTDSVQTSKQCRTRGLRMWVTIAAIYIMAVKIHHATVQLPKVPPFATTAWISCFLGDKGSLPWKVTKQSSRGSFSCDKSYCMGPEGSGIQGKSGRKQTEKSVTPALWEFKWEIKWGWQKLSFNIVDFNLKQQLQWQSYRQEKSLKIVGERSSPD